MDTQSHPICKTEVSLRQTHSAGPKGVHLKADLEGTIFAYDCCARLAYVKTFDHPEGPQQGSQMLPSGLFFPLNPVSCLFYVRISIPPYFSFEFLAFKTNLPATGSFDVYGS